ncbi:hypothetical protein ACFLTD_03305 [Elusimicrobiota bacterium]
MPYIQKNDKKSMKLINDTKSGRDFREKGSNSNAAICPSCKAEVVKKQGFRLSAMSCPECGTRLGKKQT